MIYPWGLQKTAKFDENGFRFSQLFLEFIVEM